jgi:signal transduction histidine kinase
MINEALALKRNPDRVSVPIAFEHYPWKNPGELQPRYKTAAVVYFEPWDWVLGAGYYEDER